MKSYPDSIKHLIEEFSRFPGIGKKTAQRLVFHILKAPDEYAVHFSEALMDMKMKIINCSLCGGITEQDPCNICSDIKRDETLICVVEDSSNVFALEKTNSFRGLYHVLGGILSPLEGVGPQDLNLNSLLDRVKPQGEVVIATNPSIEGDATALYILKILKDKNIKITRLARGLPVGGALEFTDEATLLQALEGRTAL
ncbi:MAG: recombination mediator RecR [Candidatus Neomarinimicrobiota bacterium]